MNEVLTLGHVLGERLGLIPQERWVMAIERARNDLETRHGCSLGELAEKVVEDESVFMDIAGVLSVGETYFFRHPQQFDLLVSTVDRFLIRSSAKRMQIWSAGCSSGEEAYSAAIAILDKLGPSALSRVEIVGTDVDRRAVLKAENAVYSEWSFRSTTTQLRAQFFERLGHGHLRLASDLIRDAVRFENRALEQAARRRHDATAEVVFFRNVGIYLSDAARSSLHAQFARVLAPEGILFQGPSDPAPNSELFRLDSRDQSVCTHICQDLKRTEAAVLAPVPPPSAAATPGPLPRAPRPTTSSPSAKGDAWHTRGSIGPTRAQVRLASSLAERGHPGTALAPRAECRSPTTTSHDSLRHGQALLAAGKLDEAVDAMRASVFLDSSNVEARYWLAVALRATSQVRPAERQLIELEGRLAVMAGTETVTSNHGTAAELLSSVRAMLDEYR